MPSLIPFGSTVDSVITVNLEGRAYDLRYRWNNFSNCWYIYLGFAGEQPILKTKLLVGFDLLAPFKAKKGVPKGAMYLVDSIKQYGRPEEDDVGIDERFKILYLSKRELGQ